jgi:CRP-like cAMP-binding protein/uncharacterized protein (DUF2249 family)
MKATQLDVRGLPVWERPQRVLEVLDRLPDNGAVLIVTENEPRGLVTQIALSQRSDVIVDHRRVGDREWHVRVKRAEGNGEELTPVSALKRVAEFSELPDDAIASLALRATQHSVRRAQPIARENTDWPYLGIVIEGTVALSTGENTARQRLFYEIFPFEIFGVSEFFDESVTLGRYMALSKQARYLRIPSAGAREVARAYPDVLLALGRTVVQRKRALMESLRVQSSMPILARIASVLLPFALPERGLSPAVSPLPHMTQAQIAASAGTVKEVAARAIAELESRGMLKRERGHIRFLDRQKLVDLVNEERV